MMKHPSSAATAPVRSVRSGTVRKIIVALFPILFGGILAGCGTSSADVGGGANDGAVAVPAASDCQQAATFQPAAHAGTVTLVFDNSRSSATADLSPVIQADLRADQAKGDRLDLIPVNGVNRAAGIERTVALDPDPGVDSSDADSARSIVIGCVNQWAHEQGMLPTSSGSDVLDAIGVAARQHPTEILVVSDGVNNAPPFDVNALHFDGNPDEVAGDLADEGALAPELKGQTVVWNGMSDTAVPLPQAVRTNLQDMWKQILKKAGVARMTFDSTSTVARRDVQRQLPQDDVVVPAVSSIHSSCGAGTSIPGALLFTGDSAVLQPGATQYVEPAVTRLTQHPTWVAYVNGYAAQYGTVAGQQLISQKRADAVAKLMEGRGVSVDQVVPRGYGANHPVANEFPGGVHDPAAAARNRRVDITTGPKGCRS